MICLSCKQQEGIYLWSLTPTDFGRLLGEEREFFRVEDCICDSCFNLAMGHLDKVVFEYWKTLQQPTQKECLCLHCKQNEAKHPYWITPLEFKFYGFDVGEKFKLEKAFCEVCYNDYPKVELDEILLNHWKQSNGIEDTTQKSHYYKWHSVSECVKISQEFNGNLAQAMQYIWRSETTNPNAVTKGKSIDEVIDDLQKAQNFIGYEIDRLKGKIQQ